MRLALRYIQAWLFYGIYTVCTIIIAILVLVARMFGRDMAWNVGKLWGLVGNFLLWLICGIKIKVEGREHIPAEPCVVAVKHQSTWETAALPALLPAFAWILKKELMYIPFFGWALYALGAIAIVRSNPREALKQVNEKGRAQLRAGRSVVIFPEGTRTAIGEAGTYKPGVILLAKKAGVAILPIAHNAGVCWPKGTILKYSGTITLRILPLVSAKDVVEKTRNELLTEIEERIETACRALGG